MAMRLRKLRIDHGLTIKEVAAAAGYSPMWVSYVERGLRSDRRGVLEAALRRLGAVERSVTNKRENRLAALVLVALLYMLTAGALLGHAYVRTTDEVSVELVGVE